MTFYSKDKKKQEVIIKFKGNTERSLGTDVIIMQPRNQSKQQSRQIKKQIMRPLLSVSVILFSLHIFLIYEVSGAEVSRSQISRWKRQEAPADFDCSLCGYCQ